MIVSRESERGREVEREGSAKEEKSGENRRCRVAEEARRGHHAR